MVARVDQVTDAGVVADLLLARRGQAYFSRKLMELRDEEVPMPSALPGWSRARVIARVGLHARVLAELIDGLSGRPTEDEALNIRTVSQWRRSIDFSATLPVRALRNLSDHAAVHLNVEWRDLPNAKWNLELVDFTRTAFAVSATPWQRAVQVWINAIDLGNGGRWGELPRELCSRLLEQTVSQWPVATGGVSVVLESLDDDRVYRAGARFVEEAVVRGTTAALTRWVLGRGRDGVAINGATVPNPPRLVRGL